jgi:hypothetical protein
MAIDALVVTLRLAVEQEFVGQPVGSSFIGFPAV